MTDIYTADKRKYILAMAVYFFWLQCISWLNHILTLSNTGKTALSINYSVFYFGHAAGCLFFVFLYGKLKDRNPSAMSLAAAAATIMTCALIYAVGVLSGYLLMLTLLFIGITSGFIPVILQNYMFNYIPLEKRGRTMGAPIGTALFINFVLFIVLLPVNGGASESFKREYSSFQVYFNIAVFIMAGLCAALLCWVKADGNPAAKAVPRSRGSKPRLTILLAVICLFFYSNIGIQDCLVSFSWFAGGNYMFFTRIFSIAGAILAGLLCDRKGRHVPVLSSQGLLAAGLISLLFAYKGLLAFIGLSIVQLAYMAFDISIKLIFIDMARYSKRPVLTASFGFILPCVARPLGILSGDVLQKLGTIYVFVVLILLVAACAPFISMLFEEIRSLYIGVISKNLTVNLMLMPEAIGHVAVPMAEGDRDNYMAPSSDGYKYLSGQLGEKFGLTAREIQVLQLVLLGQSVSEMAQNLYISEITIKTHIGRILKKSGTRNRTQLISSVLNENCNNAG